MKYKIKFIGIRLYSTFKNLNTRFKDSLVEDLTLINLPNTSYVGAFSLVFLGKIEKTSPKMYYI